MPRRLPPLNPVRAFEAVARTGSFSAAAEELSVTTSAVSLQVKALESYLGFRLFVRNGKALTLTARAGDCLPKISAALDLLAEAGSQWRAMSDAAVLRLRLPPGFADFWLIPRLPRFRERCPETEVRIATLPAADPGNDAEDDLTVSVLSLGSPGKLLFPLEMAAICSPEYLGRSALPLAAPADLLRHRLLHIDFSGLRLDLPDWSAWLQRFDMGGIDAAAGVHFDSPSAAVKAARNGLGLVLAPKRLLAREIADGHLMCAFDPPFPADRGYIISSARGATDLPRIAAFRRWLIEEADHDALAAQE